MDIKNKPSETPNNPGNRNMQSLSLSPSEILDAENEKFEERESLIDSENDKGNSHLFSGLFKWLLRPKKELLWHPESPGVSVLVNRTWIGRLFKSSAFATLSETLKRKIK